MTPEQADGLVTLALAAIVWAVAFFWCWAIVASGDREDVAPTEWK